MTKVNVPKNYIVTREQKRAIAKQNMKKAGKRGFCKHGYTFSINPFTGEPSDRTRTKSYFAEHWREYIEVNK